MGPGCYIGLGHGRTPDTSGQVSEWKEAEQTMKVMRLEVAAAGPVVSLNPENEDNEDHYFLANLFSSFLILSSTTLRNFNLRLLFQSLHAGYGSDHKQL